MLLEKNSSSHLGSGADFKSLCSIVIRSLGVVIVLISALFAVGQGWEGLSHWIKYSVFLGFTVTLAGAGIFCAIKLKEGRGARTLLALAASLVPIHFCQLGALIYSTTHTAAAGAFPKMLYWQASSIFEAALLTSIGVAVLMPLVWFAFKVLIVKNAKEITCVYFALNSFLLIPFRTGHIVILMIFLASVLLGFLIRSFVRENHHFRTKEGGLVLFLTCTPVLTLFFRSLFLHPQLLGDILPGGFLCCAGMLLFYAAGGLDAGATARFVLQRFAALAFAIGWLFLSGESVVQSSWIISGLKPLLMTVPIALAYLFFSLHADRDREAYPWYATVLVLLGCLATLQVDDKSGYIFALVCALLTTSLCGLYCVERERKCLFAAALFIFLWEIYAIVEIVLQPLFIGPWWLLLGGVGIALIVSASLLEKSRGGAASFVLDSEELL